MNDRAHARVESATLNFRQADEHVTATALELAKYIDTYAPELLADHLVIGPRLRNYQDALKRRANYLDDLLEARVAEFADSATVDAVGRARAGQ